MAYRLTDDWAGEPNENGHQIGCTCHECLILALESGAGEQEEAAMYAEEGIEEEAVMSMWERIKEKKALTPPSTAKKGPVATIPPGMPFLTARIGTHPHECYKCLGFFACWDEKCNGSLRRILQVGSESLGKCLTCRREK